MTYAAIFHLALLASRHTLAESEIAAALRLARVAHPTITVGTVEAAVTDVLATRVARVA